MKKLVPLVLLLSSCASSFPGGKPEVGSSDPNSPEAQKEMCIEENQGVLRFSRSYLEEFCGSIRNQYELICFRFVHASKEWRKACPGINSLDQLECISTIANGPSYALLDSLQKCKTVKSRKQVLCLSRAVAHSGVPLEPAVVQQCLDKNAE